MSAEQQIQRKHQNYAAFMRYPRDAWYVAAARSEVGAEPFGRKLLGRDVVLYRQEGGQVVALDDHCPHRGFRLSKSRVVGDRIQCGYHGMEFDAAGRCVKLAGGGTVPNVMRVTNYPVVEKWHWIWIWMGDPAKADPALIPASYHEHDADYEHQFASPIPFYGNWMLAQDNLLDATHATFLHAGLIDDGQFCRPPEVTVEGDVITQRFDMPGFHPSDSMIDIFHIPIKSGEKVNRRTITVHHMPCAVTTFTQVFEYQPEFSAENSGRLLSETIHSLAIVPADDNHSYHFAAVTTSYPMEERQKEGLVFIIGQDLVAFADVQEHFDTNPDAVEISVPSDKMGIIARRMVQDMVRREDERRLDMAAGA